DLYLLGIARIAHDEVVTRGIGRHSGEEGDRDVEGAPPGVDRRYAPAKGRTKLVQDESGLGCRREVGLDVFRLVGRVLAVLVERHLPGDLLRLGVDLDVAGQAANGPEYLPRHLGDGPIRGQRD